MLSLHFSWLLQFILSELKYVIKINSLPETMPKDIMSGSYTTDNVNVLYSGKYVYYTTKPYYLTLCMVKSAKEWSHTLSETPTPTLNDPSYWKNWIRFEKLQQAQFLWQNVISIALIVIKITYISGTIKCLLGSWLSNIVFHHLHQCWKSHIAR
jgi:hypothetical protein